MNPSNRRPVRFDEVGRIPAHGDNVAIATTRIEAGTRIAYESADFTAEHTIFADLEVPDIHASINTKLFDLDDEQPLAENVFHRACDRE